MRTPVSLLLVAAVGLATSLNAPSAIAGALYIGIPVPIAVTAPIVTVPAVVTAPPAVVIDDNPTIIVTSDYCCGPGWHGDGWRGYGYGWRRDGYRGEGRATYAYQVRERAGYARSGRR